jgi:hypothetical protein
MIVMIWKMALASGNSLFLKCITLGIEKCEGALMTKCSQKSLKRKNILDSFYFLLSGQRFVTKACLHFLNQQKVPIVFNTQYDLVREKQSPLRGAIF